MSEMTKQVCAINQIRGYPNLGRVVRLRCITFELVAFDTPLNCHNWSYPIDFQIIRTWNLGERDRNRDYEYYQILKIGSS